jgi:peptide/nickel transport system substrate-binding protein
MMEGITMRTRHFLVLATIVALALGTTAGVPTLAATKLSVIIDTEANRADEAQAIAGYLQQVGIQADVRIWEWNALKEKLLAGERQLYLTDWGSAYFDPFDIVVPKLRTGDRGNYSFYSNPEFDAALDRALAARTDEERARAYREAQAIVMQDLPWAFGYTLLTIEAARSEVQNWQPAMDGRLNMHDVSLSRGDTIIIGMGTDRIVTLDPAAYRDRHTETIIRNIFDGLVTRTWDGNVVPEIAESWERVSDTEWVFRLRKGIKFHDGSTLTADDVVFSINRVVLEGGMGDGMTSPRKGLLGTVQRAEKIDDSTVRVVLSEPFPVLLQAMVHVQIVPMAYVQSVGDDGFARQPVGCGPFRFVEGRLDDRVVMERFDDYWGGAPDIPPVGPAKVRRVIFRMMPDPTVRVAALMSGEVHIIQSVPPHMVAALEADSRIQVKTVEGTTAYNLEMNVAKPPFDDIRVRQAINYAIDWDAIIATIYENNASRLASPFLPSGFGYDPTVRPWPYDPAKARALLEEAGFSTR